MKKIIALVVVLLVGVIFIQMNTYEAASLIKENGFVMPHVDIEDEFILESGKLDKNIAMIPITEEDIVYKNGSKYYLGEDKTRVDLLYPIVIDDGYKIKFIQNNAYLISENFESLPVIEGMYLANAHSFHNDGSSADLESFLLAQLNNGLYINAQTMKVITQLETFDVPLYSLLYFDESFINCYAYQNGTYKLQNIRGMQNAKISIGKQTWTYIDFLKHLNIVKEEIKSLEEDKAKTEKEIEELIKKEQSVQQPIQKEETHKEEKPSVLPQTPQGAVDGNLNNGGLDNSIVEWEDQEPPFEEDKDLSEKPSQPNQDDSSDQNESHDEDGMGEDGDENSEEDGETDDSGESDSPSEDNEESGEESKRPYIEPTATFENLIPWTYTLHGDLKINDPSSRIIRSVRLSVYNESGTPVMRKQFKNSEQVVLSILEPNKTFVIEGVFQYYNDEGMKSEKVFLEKTVFHTLPIDGNIAPIDFEYELDDILLPNAFRMKSVQIKNTTDYDKTDTSLENFYKNTLPYIANVRLTFHSSDGKREAIETNLPSSLLKDLIQGKKSEYTSSAILNSNQKYSYQITFTDKFGNDIATQTIVQGEVKTSKKTPKAIIKIEESLAGKFVFQVQIKDEDDALLKEDYTIRIFDENQNTLLLEGQLNNQDINDDKIVTSGNQTIEINNLPFSHLLKMEIVSDYDTRNGEGEKKESIIGTAQFYSAPLSAGAITYTNTFHDVMGTYMTMDLDVSSRSTSALVSLLTDIELELTSSKGEVLTYLISRELINQATIDNYNDELQELVIQEADPLTHQPYISLVVDKALLEEGTYTNWELWKNKSSQILGEQGGTLRIRLSENTLTPSTRYSVKMKSKANQGNYVYDLQSLLARDNFTTKKREPQVSMNDYFIGNDFIEFYDIFTEDIDGTIINGQYSVQLKQDGHVIQSHVLKTNEKVETLRFSGLNKGIEYQVCFVAAEYNDGPTSVTLNQNVVFKEMNFIAGNGVSGDINLRDFSFDYKNNIVDKGKLDVDKIEFGKAIDPITFELIDDKERFVSDYLPVDATKEYLLKDAGGLKIDVYFYKSLDDMKPTRYVHYQGHLARICTETYNNLSSYKYMRVVGWRGYEYSTSYFPITRSQGLIQNEDILEDTTLSDSTGKPITELGVVSTEFFEVQPGQLYVFEKNSSNGVYLYDKNKEFVSIHDMHLNTIEIPSGVTYIRLKLNNYVSQGAYQMHRVEGIDEYNGYRATLSWNIEDYLKTLTSKDKYTLDIYESNNPNEEATKLIETKTFSFEDDKEGGIKKVSEILDIRPKEKKSYRYELNLIYHGNKIKLDEVSFQTKNNVHILRNTEDFLLLKRFPFDTFIAENDISETSDISFYAAHFYGVVDFQGHTLTLERESEKIANLHEGAILRNMHVDAKKRTYFINNNYGTLQNITFKIYPLETEPKTILRPVVYNNYVTGIVENFAFEIQDDLQMITNCNGLIVNGNSGIIRNGYVYHKNKDGYIYTTNDKGILTNSNNTNAIIENVYILSHIATPSEDMTAKKKNGLFAANNQGTVKNVFAVGDRKGYLTQNDSLILGDYMTQKDPLFGEDSSNNKYKYQNVYLYSKNHDYVKNHMSYIGIKELNTLSWYQSVFKDDSNLTFTESVPYGYYPRVKMDDVMMQHQPYIELPKYIIPKQPEITNHQVVKSTNTYVDVKIYMTNEDKAKINSIEIDHLTPVVLEQGIENDEFYILVRLSNPKKYVSEYQLKRFHYELNGTSYSSPYLDYPLQVEFYYPIYSFSDWALMKTSPKDNYRLMTDLDFSLLSDFNTAYINEFSGTLDGGIYDLEGRLIGMHTLENIEFQKQSSVFNKLTDGAVIKNLQIQNMTTHPSNAKTEVSFIYTSSGALLDQIHINDVSLSASTTAPLIRTLNYSIVQNCSAKNINLKDMKTSTHLRQGGLVGSASYSLIRNSYTYNINLDSDYSTSSFDTLYVGGIVGESASTKIENCYSQGSIRGIRNVGGIAGTNNTAIEKCWSDVALEASFDNAGGIVGTGQERFIRENIVLGNILTTNSSAENIHRVAGVKLRLGLNNYAYEKQLVNNNDKYPRDDVDALLTTSDLSSSQTYRDMGYHNAYDFSQIQNGQMPMLKATDGTLLPHQEPVYFNKGNNKLIVDSAVRLDEKDEKFKVVLNIEHPNFDYVGTEIEGMTIDYSATEITPIQNGSRVKLVMTKNKALDSYKVSVRVKTKEGNRVQELNGIIEFNNQPVYWHVDSYKTLHNLIESNHGESYENFMLTGNIDFQGHTSFGGLKVNRFEGVQRDENVQVTHLNFSFTDSSSYLNFIKEVNNEIKNITFNNCHLDYRLNSNKNNLGIVGHNKGNIDNVHFTQCELTSNYEGTAYISYIGMIARQQGTVRHVQGENLNVEHISVDKNSRDRYVGSLFGYVESDIRETSLSDSKVIAENSDWVGGIAGYVVSSVTSDKLNENVYGNKLTIHGHSRVGGLFGFNNYKNYSISLTDSKINGVLYVGGLIGTGHATINNATLTENDGYTASNLTVSGEDTVGGVKAIEGSVTNCHVKTLTVIAEERIAGGLVGREVGSTKCTVENSTIDAKNAAGGIAGTRTSINQCNVLESKIESESYAGGLVGTSGYAVSDGVHNFENYDGSYCILSGAVDSQITANQYAGGMIGFANTSYFHQYPVFIKDCTITANEKYAGGIAGSIQTFTNMRAYVSNSTIDANSYAGGHVGYIKAGGNEYSFRESYLFEVDVNAKNYAGGIFGGIDKDCITKNMLSKLIIYADVNGNSQSHIIGNGYDQLLKTASEHSFIKIVKQSQVNNNAIDTIVNDKAMTLIDYSDLSKYSTYKDLYDGNRWTIYSAAIDIEDLVVLPNEEANTFVIGVLGSNYSGPAEVSFCYKDTRQTKNIELTHGYGVVNFDENKGTKANIEFELKVNGKTWKRYWTGYYNPNTPTINGGSQDQVLDIGDTITLPEGHTYTWYRSYTPWWEKNVKYEGYTGNTLIVQNRGYYFAIDENGAYSSMYFVNGEGYMPLLRYPLTNSITEPLPYQSGKDDSGYYPTNEYFFYGGAKLDPYVAKVPLDTTSTISNTVDFDVYASGIHSINVELNQDVQSQYELFIECDGVTKQYPMRERVMTLSYDFVHDMTLTLKNGDQTQTKVVRPYDVRKTISTFENHYYYLVENGIVCDEQRFDLNGVHLYEDLALLDNGTVYSFKDGSLKDIISIGEQLDTVSLASDELNGYQIDTYKNFTQINGKNGESRNLRMYVKNNRLYAIDGQVSMGNNAIIIDEYQGEVIQTQLSENGELMNYMDAIVIPEDFRNKDIQEITHTLSTDSSIVLVRYKDGDLDAFNYLNGQRIEVEDMKEEPSLIDYVKEQLDILLSSDVNQMDNRYEKSFELQKELQVLDYDTKQKLKDYQKQNDRLSPLSTTSLSDASSPYTTVYDQASDSYQTYDVNTLLASQDEHRMSENDKLEELKANGTIIDIEDGLVKPKKDIQENQSVQVGFGILALGIVGCLCFILKKRKQFIKKS